MLKLKRDISFFIFDDIHANYPSLRVFENSVQVIHLFLTNDFDMCEKMQSCTMMITVRIWFVLKCDLLT